MLEPLRPVILVGIILIRLLVIDIMFIVHALSILLRMTLRLFLVEPILALCLSELVYFGTGETCE